MTQPEYEQKKRECWDEAVLHGALEVDKDLLFDHAFKCGYSLDKEKETISQEEIEDAAKDYAYDIDGSDWGRQRARDGFVDGANFALGKQEKGADTVIQGWVCRDKVINEPFTSDLFLAFDEPTRIEEWGKWGDMGDYIELDSSLFPDLTWDSDPLEVELVIKRKRNDRP